MTTVPSGCRWAHYELPSLRPDYWGMDPRERSTPVLWVNFFVMSSNFPCRRENAVQLLVPGCPRLRDVLGRGSQTSATVRTRFTVFIDTSYISVNVRYMSLGEQCSVFSVRHGGSAFGSIRWEGEPSRRWQWVRSPALCCARMGIAALVERRKEIGTAAGCPCFHLTLGAAVR
jgi:hypothetical protein